MCWFLRLTTLSVAISLTQRLCQSLLINQTLIAEYLHSHSHRLSSSASAVTKSRVSSQSGDKIISFVFERDRTSCETYCDIILGETLCWLLSVTSQTFPHVIELRKDQGCSVTSLSTVRFVSMSYTTNQPSRLHSILQRSKRQKWINNIHCNSSLESEFHQPLTPDAPTDSLVLRNNKDATTQTRSVTTVGNYLILEKIDTSLTSPVLYNAVNVLTQKKYLCKVISIDQYRDTLEPYLRAGNHENINEVQEVILGDSEAYFFFLENHGDLHTYIRDARRLKETEAASLFSQIVSAVKHCHDNGIVIRDLKLRKFVFKNRERTKLMLEGFEDSIVLSEGEDDEYDDSLSDKHGCPVYVSPEILQNTGYYSGFRADIWSMGVILYTMILGCYPFHDTNINTLFLLIRQGHYHVPSAVSFTAKCLIKNILRMKPSERLSTNEILLHPWFKHCESRSSRSWFAEVKDHNNQVVPDAENDSIANKSVC